MLDRYHSVFDWCDHVLRLTALRFVYGVIRASYIHCFLYSRFLVFTTYCSVNVRSRGWYHSFFIKRRPLEENIRQLRALRRLSFKTRVSFPIIVKFKYWWRRKQVNVRPFCLTLISRISITIHDLFTQLVVQKIQSQLQVIADIEINIVTVINFVRSEAISDVILYEHRLTNERYSKRSPNVFFAHADFQYPTLIIETSYSQKRKHLAKLTSDYIRSRKGVSRGYVSLLSSNDGFSALSVHCFNCDFRSFPSVLLLSVSSSLSFIKPLFLYLNPILFAYSILYHFSQSILDQDRL